MSPVNERRKVFITVKTYPTLSKKHDELVCTVGILDDGRWVRIYPLPFRKLDYENRYKKYQWVELDIVKNTEDPRPESYRITSIDTVEVIGEPVGPQRVGDNAAKLSLEMSDNGSEFEGEFASAANEANSRRLYTYPRCPQQNGTNELFNRTLREGFLRTHEDLADDFHLLNQALAEWLVWYNTERPHRSLNMNTPLQASRNHQNGKIGWGHTPKYIPAEVFDKRAVEKNQVVFYDVSFIEVKPHIKKKTVAVQLIDFSVFYSQDSIANAEAVLKNKGSKIVVERGQIVKVSKDKDGIVTRKQLTQNWTDWIDYWSVDFDFENKREIIRIKNPQSGGKSGRYLRQ